MKKWILQIFAGLSLTGIALAQTNTASGSHSSAQGYGNTASGTDSNAFGYINLASAQSASAFGRSNDAEANYSTAFGHFNIASQQGAAAFGYWNNATGFMATAFGEKNTASNRISLAMGFGNLSSGQQAVAVGSHNTASGYDSTAIGEQAFAQGTESVALGRNVNSAESFGVSIGLEVYSGGGASTAMGMGDYANAHHSSAIGVSNYATGDGSSAVGTENIVGGEHASSFGYQNTVAGSFASAFGHGNTVTSAATSSSAFGHYITNNIPNSVMIGPSDTAKVTILDDGTSSHNPLVGIGTTSPRELFDLGNGTGLKQLIYSTGNGYDMGFGVNLGQSPNALSVAIGGANSNGPSSFEIVAPNQTTWPYSSYTTRFAVLQNGNVGIGTANPGYKLDVIGTIHANEVLVDTSGADYVFDPHYKLMPLSQVEQVIKRDQHLPGIPSAQEMSSRGVSVGDLQTKLLAQIEELTLHMIAQQKELDALKTENAAMQARLNTMAK